MRVVEKSTINGIIAEAKQKLEGQKKDYFGKTMNAINAIDWMKSELEQLRKEVDGLVFEIGGSNEQ